MKKNPRVLALQRSQTKIFVEQSTMNKTLNKKGVYGWKHLCTFEVCKRAWGRSTTLGNVLCTDETKVGLFGRNTQCYPNCEI